MGGNKCGAIPGLPGVRRPLRSTIPAPGKNPNQVFFFCRYKYVIAVYAEIASRV